MATISAPTLAGPAHAGPAPVDARFHALYDEHHEGLYRFCLGLLRHADDARDVIQSTMVKALQALRAGTEPRSPRAWLYTIARNEAVDLLRARRGEAGLDALPELAAPELDPATRATVTALLADLHRLPEQQRSAVVLRELQGLEYEEIAEVLGTTPGNARQSVFKARTSLFDFDRGRDLACEEVRRAVSEADGRPLRKGPLSAHLVGCPECRAFRESIRRRRAHLALLPGPPVILLEALRDGTLALAATGAGVGTVGGTGAASVASAGAAGLTTAVAAPGAAVGGLGALLAAIPGVGLGAGKILAVAAVIASAGGGAIVAEREGLLAKGDAPSLKQVSGPDAANLADRARTDPRPTPGATAVASPASRPDPGIDSVRAPADRPAAGRRTRGETSPGADRPAGSRPSVGARPGSGTGAPAVSRTDPPVAARPVVGTPRPTSTPTTPAVAPVRTPTSEAPATTAPRPTAPEATRSPAPAPAPSSGATAPAGTAPAPAPAPPTPAPSGPAPATTETPAGAPDSAAGRSTDPADMDVSSSPADPR